MRSSERMVAERSVNALMTCRNTACGVPDDLSREFVHFGARNCSGVVALAALKPGREAPVERSEVRMLT